MNNKERAALLRLKADIKSLEAAQLRNHAVMLETSESIRRLGDAFRASECRELHDHPDLGELEVFLHGWYDAP